MSLFDFLKPKRFRSGKVRTPTKFKVVCNRCGKTSAPVNGVSAVTIEIPGRFQEPVIDLECRCGNGEIVSP